MDLTHLGGLAPALDGPVATGSDGAMSERLRLRFEKPGFLSRHHDVVAVDERDEAGADRYLTSLDRRPSSSAAEFALEGRAFTCRSKGVFTTRFVLELDGDEVVAMRRRGARCVLESASGRDLVLRTMGLLRPSFALLEDGEEVGTLRTTGWIAPVLHADLPGDTPLPVAVFLGYACTEIRSSDSDD